MVKWKLQRLINDAHTLRALEAYTARLEQETSISNQIIINQDSLLKVKDEIIRAHQDKDATWQQRFDNEKLLTKYEKKAKRRWRMVAIVATGLFVWVAAAP